MSYAKWSPSCLGLNVLTAALDCNVELMRDSIQLMAAVGAESSLFIIIKYQSPVMQM